VGAVVTLLVGDACDGDEDDDAVVEAPPVAHAVSVRPRASRRSVGLRDAMMTSGSAHDWTRVSAMPVQMLAEAPGFAGRAEKAPAWWAGAP